MMHMVGARGISCSPTIRTSVRLFVGLVEGHKRLQETGGGPKAQTDGPHAAADKGRLEELIGGERRG